MLASTLFFVTLFSSLFTAGSALTCDQPKDLVQCSSSNLTWSSGKGPYNVYVFTGCNDANEDPISTFIGITDTFVTWWVNTISGATVFFQVEDSTGDFFSRDGYVGGNANDADQCTATIKQKGLESTTFTANPAAVVGGAAPATPTTQTSSSSVPGYDGVVNAEQTSTSSAAATSSAPVVKAAGAISAAGTNAAPSVSLALGLLGAALLASL